MTLTPVGLFWPRPSLLFFALSLAGGGAWLAHRPALPGAALGAPTAVADLEPPTRAPAPAAIREVRRFHYRVLRAALLREASSASGRIVPSLRDARPAGFRIYAIRPTSLFARLGMQNGDLIARINGMELTSPDRALEVYSRLQAAQRVHVGIERRGVPLELVYDLID